jgi:D-apiose dehydrogenase
MKLRGAVIGCGMIAEYHLRAWQRIHEVEIVALVDPEHDRAQQKGNGFAPTATVYNDMQSMFAAETVDFVDILTPPWLHREQCLEAAGKQVHIICQKPLCDRLEDAEDLMQELAEYSKQFCVHENHPWRPWFREVLKLHQEGFFGEGLELEIFQHESLEPPETFKTEAEQGIMLDYGIHLVAMARALFGDPVTVDAEFDRINPRVRGESKASVTLKFAKALAKIDISWQNNESFQGGFILKGSQAEACLDGTLTRGKNAQFRVFQKGTVIRDETRIPTDDYRESFYLFQRAFVEAVLHNSPLPEPASNNLKTVQTTFAAYAAAATKNTL